MKLVKKHLTTIIIFLLAIFLRVNYDFFINGYNFDEIAMISVAAQKFPFEILKTASTIDYHAPLYYFIAHPFTYLENEWIYLRGLNLLFSILNIWVFYKIGKLLKNKTIGYFLALFLTVNHLAITTVSFTKFYCLCILLFSINIYYLIKIIKYDKNYTKFSLINICFIFSSTLGFIIVGIEYLAIYFAKKNKNIIKSFLISLIGLMLYLPILLKQYILAKNTLISPHSSYSGFNFIAVYNFFNDYFSPLINYCCNITPISACTYLLIFIESVKNLKIDHFSLIIFLIFSLIPVSIALFGIFISFKNKILLIINIISFIYLTFFSIIVIFQKTGFIPIYIYPCGLLFIISAIYGILNLRNKKISALLISYLILIQLIIPNYYPKEKREMSYIKEFYFIEKYLKNKNDDKTIYIMTHGGRFIEKYYKNKKIINLDTEKIKLKYTNEFLNTFLGNNKKTNKISANDVFASIKNELKENAKNDFLEKYFIKNILNKTKKGDKIEFIFYATENPFLLTDDEFKDYLNKKLNSNMTKIEFNKNNFNEINNEELTHLVSTYIYKYIIDKLDKNFKKINLKQYQRTINDDFVKIYDIKKFDKSTIWYTQNAIKGWVVVTYEKTN